MEKSSNSKRLETMRSSGSIATKNQQRIDILLSAYSPKSIRLPAIKKDKPSLRKSEPKFLILEKPNLARLVKEDSKPPWMQSIEFHLPHAEKNTSIQYDLLSQREKLMIKRKYFPDKVKSKVRQVFRASEKEEKDKKLNNIFRRIRKMDTIAYKYELNKLRDSNLDRLIVSKEIEEEKYEYLSVPAREIDENNSGVHSDTDLN